MHGETELWHVLVGAGLAIALTWLVLRLLQPYAERLNLLDRPRGRKDHAEPTPVTGGLAMAFGAIVTACFMVDAGSGLAAFVLAGSLLVVVGLLDDMYDIRWYWRILAQALAGWVMVSMGGVVVEQIGPAFGVEGTGLGVLAVPFTVFATVGIINAINMIDGIDGLAGSLVLAALLMLAAAGVYSGNVVLAERAMILCGAVATFLVFNLRNPWRERANVFMGNAGSAFLGFVIAWFSFRLTQNPGHPVTPVIALWFLPVPVADCLVLIVRRLRDGRSPFSAGRDHVHHFMLDAGFNPGGIVATLAGFTLLCGLVVGQLKRMQVPPALLLLAFFALCIAWCWLSLRRERASRFFSWLLRMLPAAFGQRQAQGT